MWYYILIYRYIYIYLWFNSFKDTSVLISLQGFGAVFVSPWRFIGPIWWDIRRSLHCPGTRNSSLGAGATQFKSKKVDQRFFFFEISNCSKLNFQTEQWKFFFFEISLRFRQLDIPQLPISRTACWGRKAASKSTCNKKSWDIKIWVTVLMAKLLQLMGVIFVRYCIFEVPQIGVYTKKPENFAPLTCKENANEARVGIWKKVQRKKPLWVV